MIRKNSLFYKIIRVKSSSKSLFDSFMKEIQIDTLVCPVCGQEHTLSKHATYERNIIDFIGGAPSYDKITVTRVQCSSCGHTHAILPDHIIPYSTYGIFFILRVLAEYFMHRMTVDQLCNRFYITHSMLYRWVKLFLKQKDQWLEIVREAQEDGYGFLKKIFRQEYSAFAQDFIQHMGRSFMQIHKDQPICAPDPPVERC